MKEKSVSISSGDKLRKDAKNNEKLVCCWQRSKRGSIQGKICRLAGLIDYLLFAAICGFVQHSNRLQMNRCFCLPRVLCINDDDDDDAKAEMADTNNMRFITRRLSIELEQNRAACSRAFG